MAWGRIKTEHAGPKRGKGYWGKKADAKQASKRSRRCEDHIATHAAIDEAALPEFAKPTSKLR